MRDFSALGWVTFRLVLVCGLILCRVPAVTAQAQARVDASAKEQPVDTEPLLYVLRQAGWLHPAKQAVEISGTLERFAGDQSDSTPIRITAYGDRKLRVDLSDSRGPDSFVLRDDAARRSSGNKPARKVSPQSARAAHEWMLPWLFLDGVLDHSKAKSIQSTVLHGQDAIGYKFVPVERVETSADRKRVPSLPPSTSEITIWISIKGVPLQIDYVLPAEDNRYAGVPCSRLFLDLREVDGVLVPTTEEAYLDTQRISRLHLDSVAISGSADDSAFTLPSEGGAR